jgi:hypothetical protein
MKSRSYSLNSSNALSYFTETLAHVDREFSEAFRNEFVKGGFLSLAREGMTEEALLRFGSGLMPPSPKTPTADGKYLVSEVKTLVLDMAKIILERARELRNPTLYLHEPYLKQNEPNTELSQALTAVDGRLFFVQALESVTPEELEERIYNYSVPWHSLALLVDRKELEPDLSSLMSDAVLIAVGAYDGESHLYWKI